MKKLVLALTVLAFCSVSFAGTPGQGEADPNQQADTAAQESIAQTTSISPNATTTCAYTFTSGNGNTYLSYCVTANGNIPQIETPFSHLQMGGGGEGYGICNESPAQNYTDDATSDTGNWALARVVSKTSTSVKIARSTSDGNWTLTQTITQVAKTSSITIVMALTNNQAVDKVAYLVRYADVNADGKASNILGETFNGAFAWSADPKNGQNPPYYGLQLQNVGSPGFPFLEGFAQTIPSGPNACAFALNAAPYGLVGEVDGSLVLAYVGPVPAHGTKTATLTYRGL
jgi:hypothetical protein